MKPGVWTNGVKRLTGSWCYNWSSDSFTILLDSVDRITKQQRRMIVNGDHPEWDNWKLLQEERKPA